MKAILPVTVCLCGMLYCCWRLQRRHAEFVANQRYKVEITVTGPDGQIIHPIARAPGY